MILREFQNGMTGYCRPGPEKVMNHLELEKNLLYHDVYHIYESNGWFPLYIGSINKFGPMLL